MYIFKNVLGEKNREKNEKSRALRALGFFVFFLNFFFHTFLKVWIKKNTIFVNKFANIPNWELENASNKIYSYPTL